MTGKKISIEDAQRFILAGISTFTLHNSKTGNSFTYNVKISDDGKLYFASVIINSEKSYLGTVNNKGKFYHGKKSKIPADAQASKVLSWCLERIYANTLPDFIEVWHEGKCGKCGRKLTVPSSIDTGIGPDCAKKLSKSVWRDLQLNKLFS